MDINEILFGLENAMYNDINSIITLLNNKKKILLIGIAGSGKTRTIDRIKEISNNSNIQYFDECEIPSTKPHINNSFINSKNGAIATIQGMTVQEGIQYSAELLSMSKFELEEIIDYCILIKHDGYAILLL